MNERPFIDWAWIADHLDDIVEKLEQHLMLLFIPAVTGVMMHFGRVSQEWLPFLAAGVGGAAITLATRALATREAPIQIMRELLLRKMRG